jgi:predicted amidohydrolase
MPARKPRPERACVWCPAMVDANAMFTPCRAAAVSFKPKKWDKAGNADKLEAAFRAAAQSTPKPDLIVGPEGALEGYVITDVIWNRPRVPDFLDVAEPIDGPYIKRFQKLARSLSTSLCFGFAERVGNDVFNSALFIDHRGQIRGTYHKVSEGTHPTWNFCRQASTLRAFDTPFGRCGILICSDRWSPITARTLVLDGAQFILIPTWGTIGKAQNQTVLGRARENGVPIVQANVGAGLIINRGEIAAYTRGLNKTVIADIDIPIPPSPQAVLACEVQVRKYQKRIQQDWYRATSPLIKKGKPPASLQPSLVSDKTFQKLKSTGWGKDKP